MNCFCFFACANETIANESLFAMATVCSFSVTVKGILVTGVDLSVFTFVAVLKSMAKI